MHVGQHSQDINNIPRTTLPDIIKTLLLDTIKTLL